MSPTALWLLAVSHVCAANADPPSPLAGTWRLDGNGFVGDLVIQLGKDNQLAGTMYGSPIAGTFDPLTQRVVIKRLRENIGGGTREVQVYTGVLAAVEGSNPPRYSLAGKFQSVAGPQWGEPGKEYDWTAVTCRLPSPAEELEALQGRWEIRSSGSTGGSRYVLPAESGLTEQGTVVVIRGNELVVDGKIMATLTNDFSSGALEGEKRRGDHRLLMFTLPSGKGLVCVYTRDEDHLAIIYPHTIGRLGPGHCVNLKRPDK